MTYVRRALNDWLPNNESWNGQFCGVHWQSCALRLPSLGRLARHPDSILMHVLFYHVWKLWRSVLHKFHQPEGSPEAPPEHPVWPLASQLVQTASRSPPVAMDCTASRVDTSGGCLTDALPMLLRQETCFKKLTFLSDNVLHHGKLFHQKLLHRITPKLVDTAAAYNGMLNTLKLRHQESVWTTVFTPSSKPLRNVARNFLHQDVLCTAFYKRKLWWFCSTKACLYFKLVAVPGLHQDYIESI